MDLLTKIINGFFKPDDPIKYPQNPYHTITTSNTTSSIPTQAQMNAQLAQNIYMNAQHALYTNAQHAQHAHNMGMTGAQQGIGMGKGIGGYSANGLGGPTYEIDEKVYKLERYAELSGDVIQRIVLEEGEPCTDLKIIMLKASNVGELVKDVGIKLSENRFAVYREKGEIYV